MPESVTGNLATGNLSVFLEKTAASNESAWYYYSNNNDGNI